MLVFEAFGDIPGANPRFVVTNLASDERIVDPTYHRPRVDGKQSRQVLDPGTNKAFGDTPGVGSLC